MQRETPNEAEPVTTDDVALPVTTDDAGEPDLRFVELGALHFDPRNPRLPTRVDGSDPSAVLTWMLEDATLVELMASIGQQGFFVGEPLLVVEEEDRLVVVEGNRRLAALRLLQDPDIAPTRRSVVLETAQAALHRPASAAVVQFGARSDILDYLGYRHITGIKEWEPLAKARYLRGLWESAEGTEHERLRLLAKKIGSRPGYVARLLRGLGLYSAIEDRHYYGLENLDEQGVSFSLLTTAVSFDNIVDFLRLRDVPPEQTAERVDEERLEELTRWIYEPKEDGRTVLGDSRNLKVLAAVAANEQALDVLRAGLTLEDAAQFSEAANDSLLRNLRLAYRKLGTAQQVIPRVDDPSTRGIEMLEEIIGRAEDMRESLIRRQRRALRRSEDV